MTNDTSSSPLSLPEVTILPSPLNHPLPLHPSLPPPPPKVEIPVPMVESKLTASSCKIYVGNLPEITTVVDLQDCFGQIGECACALKRGFGFVVGLLFLKFNHLLRCES